MAAFKQPVQHYAGNFRTVKPPAVTRWQATAQVGLCCCSLPVLLQQHSCLAICYSHESSEAPIPLQGSQAELHKPIKIVGCGSCGVDYLASVAAFPQPDQKLRTDALEVYLSAASVPVLLQQSSICCTAQWREHQRPGLHVAGTSIE
jgi:hypothetical protein